MNHLRQFAQPLLHTLNEFTFQRKGARVVTKYRLDASRSFPKAGNFDLYAFLVSHGFQISAWASEAGSINETSSSPARELFTRFDTGHLCSTSFAAGLSNSMPAFPEKPGLELIWFEHCRHSVVDFGTELVGVGDHHRARSDCLANLPVVPCGPQPGNRDRLFVAAREVVGLLAIRRVLPFVVAARRD